MLGCRGSAARRDRRRRSGSRRRACCASRRPPRRHRARRSPRARCDRRCGRLRRWSASNATEPRCRSLGAREVGAERLGDALLAGPRTVGEHRAQRRMLALVDAQRRRAFRRQAQQIFARWCRAERRRPGRPAGPGPSPPPAPGRAREGTAKRRWRPARRWSGGGKPACRTRRYPHNSGRKRPATTAGQWPSIPLVKRWRAPVAQPVTRRIRSAACPFRGRRWPAPPPARCRVLRAAWTPPLGTNSTSPALR